MKVGGNEMKLVSSIRLALETLIDLLSEFPEKYRERKEFEEAYKRALEKPFGEERFGKAIRELDFEKWKKEAIKLGNKRW